MWAATLWVSAGPAVTPGSAASLPKATPSLFLLWWKVSNVIRKENLGLAYLQVFCAVEELENWIRILCNNKMLHCLMFRSSTKHKTGLIVETDQLRLTEDVSRIFLYPE